jgi:catechol-2,3-dioxygenase
MYIFNVTKLGKENPRGESIKIYSNEVNSQWEWPTRHVTTKKNPLAEDTISKS